MSDLSYWPLRLERTATGWLLQISGCTDATVAESYLWPYGTPPGVTVTLAGAVAEPAPIGDFEITGLTQASVEAMDPEHATWFMQQTELTMHETGAPQQPDAGALPEAFSNVSDADYARSLELLVGLTSAAEASVEETLAAERLRGSCFGMLWRVTGHPDLEPTYNADDPYTKAPDRSWEDMKHAFDEGVGTGRARAEDLDVYNSLAAAIGWQMEHTGLDLDGAASLVLTEVWQQVTGGTRYQFVDFP